MLNKQIYLSTFYWSNLLNISHFVSPNPRLYHLHHCYNVPQLGDYLAHITPCPTLSQDSWNMLRTFVSVLDHQSWEPASVCMTHNHFGKFRQTLIFLCTVKPVLIIYQLATQNSHPKFLQKTNLYTYLYTYIYIYIYIYDIHIIYLSWANVNSKIETFNNPNLQAYLADTSRGFTIEFEHL